jgi:AcrR family transcriptional regulator
VFAACGYEGATVRAIAAEARVAPAMLIRYFGSKEGVFAAAVDFQLDLPDLSAAPPATLGPALVGHFLDRWESPERQGDLAALLKASVAHEAARERMTRLFSEQLVARLQTIMQPEDARLCAGLVASQMLGLAFCRYVLLLEPVVAMPKSLIVRTVGRTLQQYLQAAVDADLGE